MTLVFFAHRFRVSKRRTRVLKDLNLLQKIKTGQKLNDEDIKGLEYVLWSLSVSKEKQNYLIISVFSVIAIALSLAMDLGFLG